MGATVRDVVSAVDCEVGVHLHNDTGCGVANALAGVAAGATQVQGTINGYGERVGNCDLVPIVANLSLKMGVETLPEGRLAKLTPVAHHVAELVNFAPIPSSPTGGPRRSPIRRVFIPAPSPALASLRARRSGVGWQRDSLPGLGDVGAVHH
ncbi:MAG: hypothetical protein Ct9H300mP31_18880 [Acidimicrobiaceae bacterium]|nr:MAG: hypothetical protein Ct9H300mP31_18880 [Acidimicrobiaceae bacterium]